MSDTITIDNDEQGATFAFDKGEFKVDIDTAGKDKVLTVEPQQNSEYTIEFDDPESVWVTFRNGKLQVKFSQYDDEKNRMIIYPFDVF